MYSPRIVSRQVERAEQQFGIKLKRYDVGTCLDAREKLDAIRNEDGKLRRPLTPTERAFITNESLLSKFDFRYWAERYCNPPEAPIWMADFSFKPIGEIKIGDKIIGWKKVNLGRSKRTGTKTRFAGRDALCVGEVLAISRRKAPIVRVTMESGTVIRCTPDHLWSSGHNGRMGHPWVKAQKGRILRRFAWPEDSAIPHGKEYAAGWLAGIYDGEGHRYVISQYKKVNPDVYERICQTLEEFGLPYTRQKGDKGIVITGGRRSYVKFINACNPSKKRSLQKQILAGADAKLDKIVDVTPDQWEGEVVSMQTTTGNYVAWGYASKNCTIERDGVEGGGLGQMTLSGSQEIVLTHLARAEDQEWAKSDRGETCDGILMLFNKARQMYLTMISRALLMHRLTFYHNTRGISASVDEDKIKELYDRDKRIYNCGLDKDEYSKKGGLPWWMRPALNFDVKAGHMNWAVMGSSILYQFSTQGSALGQGRQFDIGHLTECAYWPEDVLQTLRRDLFPTFPQSRSTLLLLESVSFGRSGWWYELSKAAEAGRIPRWRFCFIPWYAIEKKYRRTPPPSWSADDITQRHADMVWETSIDYVGLRVRLAREQMYWWETTREEYRQAEQLSDFLTNFSATPEEGFQHSNPTAVSHETLSRLHDEARAARPVPYLLRMDGSRSADDDWTKGKVPSYQVGNDAIVPAHPDEIDSDPRGIVWMWEPPRRSGNYYIGIDSTNGIIPWNRNIRNEEDYKTDNGAIAVMRVPREEDAPDIQVAEYAAPIDQEELGKVANLLGRIYGGSNEDGQALAITEVHLGMGLPVIRKMMDSGYLNHFAWQHIDKIAVTNTSSYGWYASPTSVRILWEKLRKHLALRRIRIKSQWLVEELGDALWDAGKQTANAASGKHDDRIRALALCVWAAHMWGTTPELETTEDQHKQESKVDWQKRAISYEHMQDEMNELVEGWLD